MQENHPNSDRRAVTQPSLWSPAERAALKRLAARKARKADLLRMFPGRTLGAIKVKLSAERKSQGINMGVPENLRSRGETEPTMLDPGDEGLYAPTWQDSTRSAAIAANVAYLAALQQHAA